MSTSLTIPQAQAQVNWTFLKTNAWNTNTSNQATYSYTGPLAAGTGANSCQRILADQVTITSGSTQTYTLDSFTDMFGQTTQAFTKVRILWIQPITTTSTAGLEVAGTFMQVTSNAGGVIAASTTTGKLELGPLSLLYIERTDSTAYSVVASTGNTLTVKNLDAASQVVNILVIGE